MASHLFKNKEIWPCVAGGMVLGGAVALFAAEALRGGAERSESRGMDDDGVLELLYFDIAGKAEAIRLMAAFGGVPFKDTRISGDDFNALKAKGELPFGQVPILRLPNGEVISQSSAIAKYVGKRAGLYPVNDDVLAAKIDALMDGEIDLFTGLNVSRYPWRYGFDAIDLSGVRDRNCAGTLKVRSELNATILPGLLGRFEAMLEKSASGWLAGTPGPTIIDFVMAPRLEWLIHDNDGISPAILNDFPRLVGLMNRVMKLHAVEAYYKARGFEWDSGSLMLKKVAA